MGSGADYFGRLGSGAMSDRVEFGIPWTVRYAIAQHDAGRPVPSWLLLSVQMVQNGGGCASCGAVGR